jgi:2-keto-4-pentenoate hydratase/2-oxohepta-3-ene-1,7-dioic acid hydratase in catechol pathway
MRLLSFLPPDSSTPTAGELREDRVVAFREGTVLDRITTGDRAPADGPSWAFDEVTLLAPIERPPAIFAIGLNYAEHAREVGRAIPEYPFVFTKLPTSSNAPTGQIRRPAVVKQLDYEAELTIVIGADGAIAGYTVANDVSGRDLQRSEPQVTRAKGADTFCPWGPWITTVDEMPDPRGLRITACVNGELRQDANTRDLVFGPEAIVAYLQEVFTLEPGDIILTGTPSGVGTSMKPPRYLEPGDVVRIEIERLGVLEHEIVAA